MCLAACSKKRRWHSGRPDAAYHSDDRQSFADSGGMTAASTRATDTDFELGDKVGLKVTMTADGKDFVSNKPMTFDGTDFKAEGFLMVRGRQCDLDALRLLSLAGGRGYSRGILGQGRSERRQLHGFGPDRGREGGRQADAVVHADDLQAQDVAHRYRRDERIGFRYYEYRHQGRRGDGRTRSRDGQLYGQSGRGGFRPDRQIRRLRTKSTMRFWCRRTVSN